ncbi:DnaD domain protein [Paenibacillus sp. CF384]|uniref:DnaD domain protein n=1 Tax=Paenibacillus sp. CF384 TaxID=1884382 RepID=UPI0008987944|nr:DnaD domain protein [Paenibacillus sp. CF384]SDW29201.1 DNA replication protein DnaD [Paenibacillus sp. CF384]
MKTEMWKAYARGMAAAMNGGGVVVPAGLLRAYRGIGLTDTEMLLMLQLMTYRQVEGIDFPTPEQLAERLGILPNAAHQLLSRLMKEELLAIDEEIDPVSGMQFERYNWNGFIIRSAEWLAEEARLTFENDRELQRAASVGVGSGAGAVSGAGAGLGASGGYMAGGAGSGGVGAGAGGAHAGVAGEWPKQSDLFSVFEQEFGRPLSPMECETISAWVDQDRYPDELIRFALKESVFAGKLHFRYIDRILIEWSRNRVTNTDEAKAHTQKFRGGRGSS